MKSKYVLLLFLFFTSFTINAQLINNGGTIIVKDGATLQVNSDVNNNSGTLQLEANATLEVSGDFKSENAAGFDADAGSTTKFFGATSKEIQSGGDDFGNVIMDKDNGINMSLIDNMAISGTLQFPSSNANKLILGAYNLDISSGTTVSNAGNSSYIQADGTGMLKRKYDATGTFTYPVGDNDEYSPIDVNVTAGTFGSVANVAVNVVDAVHPNKYSDADDHITRYWNVDATDISGYTATLTGTYTDADIAGTTESNIKGASYDNTDWNFVNASGDDANNTITADVTANADFTGMNFYGKMSSLKAFLQGAYSGSEMKTTLTTLPLGPNDGDHFPNISPYGTGETISSIPTDVTDWIKIELWDAVPPNVTKSYSKFIKKNGEIIEDDGSTVLRFKEAPNSSYVIIHHRNHLDVRTTNALDLTTSPTFDFSDSGNQNNVFNEGWTNAPQKDLGNGIFGMWGGNANENSNTKWNGSSNDRGYLLNTILSGNKITILNNTYSNGDLNFDKKVKWNGSSNDRGYLLNNVLSGNKTTILKEHK